MNLILLSASDMLSDTSAQITDQRRLSHIHQVHAAKAGEQLKVGLLNGKIGTGTINTITADKLQLTLSLTQPAPQPLNLTMILALPRPKMLKRILQTIATLGVKKLHLINSYRVEKSYWQTPFLTPESIHEQLLLGLEQGYDTLMPEVSLHKRFKPFVEDELPSIIEHSKALVAHPYTSSACPRNLNERLSLAIGPEGGFIPYEIDLLETCGFEAVHLGERIMRVETAVPYLLGRLF